MGMWLMFSVSAYAIPLVLYLAFAVPALYYLRQRDLDETARAVWSLAIISVPIMGAVAFATIGPGLKPAEPSR